MSRLLSLLVLTGSISIFAGSSTRGFVAPTELDKLLDASPIPMADNTDTVSAKSSIAFQVQLAALSDIDSAQARKASLEQTVGGKIDLVFDPPYYKLRFGSFATKQEAEDELVDLAGKNIQGFVVRQ